MSILIWSQIGKHAEDCESPHDTPIDFLEEFPLS